VVGVFLESFDSKLGKISFVDCLRFRFYQADLGIQIVEQPISIWRSECQCKYPFFQTGLKC